MRTRDAARRWFAAGAVALYAFVSLLLLPLHLLESASAMPDRERPGAAVAAWCQDGNCHDPVHRHDGRRHVHDPATCVKCGQSTAPRTPVPAAASALPAPLPVPAAPPASAPRAVSLPRSLPSVRGPPALS